MFRNLKLISLTLISLLFNNERGWIHPQTGWEIINTQNMAFYFIQSAYLDNIELEDQQRDVIGVFFNEQCIGWAFYSSGLTGISTTGDNGSLPGYPVDGDIVEFKFYDHSDNEIIDAFITVNILPWRQGQILNIQNIYSCSSQYPIINDGTCIESCLGDPNLDGEINILDVVEIISLIVNCTDSDACYESNLECMDYNNDQSINILDVISIVNSIV
tara:strand:- start:194 stop:841 length:648 start_codon:yes stop_codon:yes gene_type:complete